MHSRFIAVLRGTGDPRAEGDGDGHPSRAEREVGNRPGDPLQDLASPGSIRLDHHHGQFLATIAGNKIN